MSIMTATRQSTGWTADASTFGARLALIRQRMGWGNVAEAAKAVGIPVASWRNWERDNREPHRLTMVAKQIATATGCDYYWLVHGPVEASEGDGGTTRQYSPEPHVVATVGEPHPSSIRRPVQRTHPIGRPRTPIAA